MDNKTAILKKCSTIKNSLDEFPNYKDQINNLLNFVDKCRDCVINSKDLDQSTQSILDKYNIKLENSWIPLLERNNIFNEFFEIGNISRRNSTSEELSKYIKKALSEESQVKTNFDVDKVANIMKLYYDLRNERNYVVHANGTGKPVRDIIAQLNEFVNKINDLLSLTAQPNSAK